MQADVPVRVNELLAYLYINIRLRIDIAVVTETAACI